MSDTFRRLRSSAAVILVLGLTVLTGRTLLADEIAADAAIPPIPRTLPPPGIEIPADEKAKLKAAIDGFANRYTAVAKAKEQKWTDREKQFVQKKSNPFRFFLGSGSLSDNPEINFQMEVRRERRLLADIEVFLKAVTYAYENDEFFDLRELKTAHDLLAEGQRRLEEWNSGKRPTSWEEKKGPVVRGFRSSIDGSVQPYGVVIPENLRPPEDKAVMPIYVWLHGRGDKMTDLQFIAQRMSNAGQFLPSNGIVIHPFGRYCNAFKYAGETDVFESALAGTEAYSALIRSPKSNHTQNHFVLIGFSMGGAGAWHLGAHYPGVWSAVSPGAGFAETARYQNLTPERFPPWYEQRLWGLYDVPGYVRNLYNAPVIAYSGELDKQIQAARVMEEAFAREGRKLDHRIGPGMGHKYHPDVLKQLTSDLEKVSTSGALTNDKATLQTRTLRYPGPLMAWLRRPDDATTFDICLYLAPLLIHGLEKHWVDSRLDIAWKPGPRQWQTTSDSYAEAIDEGLLLPHKSIDRIESKGIRSFSLHLDLRENQTTQLRIDSDVVKVTAAKGGLENIFEGVVGFAKVDGHWKQVGAGENGVKSLGESQKRPFLQGPIDDAFYDPFLVVVPSGKSKHPAVERWVQFELAHFKDRWRRLFRGDVRMKKDDELTKDDHERYHLIAWGDADSNALIKTVADKLPIKWNQNKIAIGDQSYDSAGHVPVMIYPNPHPSACGNRYIVLNSGPTFREGHDTSNSLQTPKLPDWAVVDLSVLPDGKAPGRIADAGFFDEQWQLTASPEK